MGGGRRGQKKNKGCIDRSTKNNVCIVSCKRKDVKLRAGLAELGVVST